MGLIKKIREKRRHRLLLQTILIKMDPFGLEIMPYYWIQEGIFDRPLEEFEKPLNGFRYEFFTREDMKAMGAIVGRRDDQSEEKLLERLDKGCVCFGAKQNGHIASFTWYNLNESTFHAEKIQLKKNEAYLFDMYTLDEFRGKNLAPHVRYQSYKALHELGRDVIYSVYETFNKPSIRFKSKLKARFLQHKLFIRLFHKFEFKWILKNYVD